MKHAPKKFGDARAVLLATTGLASTVLMSGISAANAEGLYFGLSAANMHGDTPFEANGEPDNYELSGMTPGIFIGSKLASMGGLDFSGEFAYQGFSEGDPARNSSVSQDGAYGINYMFDAKLRVGTDMGKAFGLEPGKLTAYGFAGKTFGGANDEYGAYVYPPNDYMFSGSNFGVGVETTMANNMFVGLEAIRRNVHTYEGDDTSHNAMSLRVGFKF